MCVIIWIALGYMYMCHIQDILHVKGRLSEILNSICIYDLKNIHTCICRDK